MKLKHSILIMLAVCVMPVLWWGGSRAGSNDDRTATPAAKPGRPDDAAGEPPVALAGRYYHGDGLGVNCSMAITKDGRFSFRWTGCLGVYDQNDGKALLRGGQLILQPERPNVHQGFRGTPTVFVPVAWGERIYLVAADEAKDFCNAVNQGQEPRDRIHGHVYLRWEDWTKPVEGLPIVPPEWKPLLLKTPLRAIVLDPLQGGRARVGIGTADGVWKGMALWADAQGFGLVEVVEADAHACVITTKYPELDKVMFTKGMGVRSRLDAGNDVLVRPTAQPPRG